MTEPDFNALNSLQDAELARRIPSLIKEHLWNFHTMFEEGDLDYIRDRFASLMGERDSIENLLLDRLEQIAKREGLWDLEDPEENSGSGKERKNQS